MSLMKSHTVLFLLLFLAISVSYETVWGSPQQLEYTIEVYADGSAAWIIEHRFLKGENESFFAQLSNPIYFSDVFIENVKSLVNATRENTGRTNMTVEDFVMTATVLGSYSVVKYQFNWKGFAETEGARIKIGDVFMVDGLFLYGEGTVKMLYPSEYIVESVSPNPHVESNQTLTWYGIEDFGLGEPKIVLGKEKAASGFLEILKANIPVIVSLIALVGVSSISLYFFKLRKKEISRAKAPMPPGVPLRMEDDEEKVINLLRAAGGSLYQSIIADQCGFSRAKASKLLATMEKKGKIRRAEKGREKVVTLIDKS